tara:strand:- start:5849 stop:6412 length:564 start_codon:yes stop_codon:yes gene_type:complete
MLGLNKISQFTSYWKNKGFEILLICSLLFLGIFAFWYWISGKKGTYSKDTYFVLPTTQLKKNKAPQESKGEIECRKVLQNLFNKPFAKERPDFLRNPVTGGNFNLELDCYNKELSLAVEYNGAQHYKFIPYFHRNNDHFMAQKYRDDMKRRLCKENFVNLIEVPYTIKINDIKKFLKEECIKLGYSF